MARICFRVRFLSRPVPELAASFVVVLSLGLTMPTPSEAGRLSTILTPNDLARPELLDQNGLQLEMPSPNHRHPAWSSGSTPTYIAFPLNGGEHLPSGTETLTAGTQAGQTTVGPLDLDAALKTQLDAALAASTSGMAVVDTPNQNYLIKYLPRSIRSHSGSTSSASTRGGTNAVANTYNAVRTWLAAEAPGVGQTTVALQSTKAKSSSAGSELASLLNSGSSMFNSLSTKGVAELEKLLKINSSTPTTKTPSLNLEAQELAPLPPPIPEPSTWLVFGLILGAAGIRKRLSRGQALSGGLG